MVGSCHGKLESHTARKMLWVQVNGNYFINLLLVGKTNNTRVFAFSSIQALLSAPNPDDPLSEKIAKHWKSNEVEAVETGIFCDL